MMKSLSLFSEDYDYIIGNFFFFDFLILKKYKGTPNRMTEHKIPTEAYIAVLLSSSRLMQTPS